MREVARAARATWVRVSRPWGDGVSAMKQANTCIPSTDSYKFYTDNPGCTPNAVYVSTADTTGKLRLNRQGATIRGYYWNGTGWVEAMNRTGPTGPLVLDLNSGTNGTLTSGHTAYFDNLVISGGAAAGAHAYVLTNGGTLLSLLVAS